MARPMSSLPGPLTGSGSPSIAAVNCGLSARTAQRLFDKSEKPCVGNLAWSPNSQQIAFVGHGCTPVSAPEEVWVVNRDGADPRVVHSFEWQSDQAEVLWSDDGQKILCAHRYEDKETTLLISASGVGEPSTMDRLPYWWHLTFWPQWGGGK
jgi:Tol biopolymer transport system component